MGIFSKVPHYFYTLITVQNESVVFVLRFFRPQLLASLTEFCGWLKRGIIMSHILSLSFFSKKIYPAKEMVSDVICPKSQLKCFPTGGWNYSIWQLTARAE